MVYHVFNWSKNYQINNMNDQVTPVSWVKRPISYFIPILLGILPLKDKRSKSNFCGRTLYSP
jgi:hypothetical protein